MISFQCDGVEMPRINQQKVQDWVRRVAASYAKIVGDIGYVFCNDEKILDVNRKYLQHDYYTDIITFDYSTGKTISGDLFISIDTVSSNSKQQHTAFADELNRVMIHGILHLCGINDKGPGERAIMEAAENRALIMLAES